MTTFRLITLGPPRLLAAGGDTVALRRKALALLVYVARRAPQPVARSELATLLWGDSTEERARLSLRQTLLQLRRVLGDAIRVTREHVALEAPVELDLREFEQDVAAGRFADAVARWEGDFLAGVDSSGDTYGVWVEGERAAARRQLAHALDALVQDATARGAREESVRWARRRAELAPLDERAHRGLAEALVLAGRPAEAVALHAAFLARQRAETEREPSAELLRFGDELERAAARTAQREGASRSPGSAGLFSPDLVGRADAFAALADAWADARAGRAAVVLVTGEQGSGKTRLVDQFLRGLTSPRQRALVLHGGGYEGDRHTALAGARRVLERLDRARGLVGAPAWALAELARIVPALRASFPNLDAPARGPHALEDALARALEDVAAEVPVVVSVDDAQLLDAASRELFVAVARRTREARILFIFTAPMGDETLAVSLRDVVGGVRRIPLAALDTSEVETLLSSMMELDPDDRRLLAQRLADGGGGIPFDVVAVVAALVDDGYLAPDARGIWRLAPSTADAPLPIPESVRAAVRRRLERLSEPARAVLGAAAAIGKPFDTELLVAATGQPSAVVASAFEELLGRRLVRQSGAVPGRYELANGVLYGVAYEQIAGAPQNIFSAPAAPAPPRRRVARRLLGLGGVAAASLAVIAIALALLAPRSRIQARAGGAGDAPATLAIAEVRHVGGDSAAAWLPEGFARLVAARLSSSELHVADVADVERVRAARGGGAGTTTSGPAPTDDLLAVGRRLDVRWVARGTVMRGDSTLLLELEVLDVASGARVRRIAAGGVDLLALADATAAQLLDLARAGTDGPRLAELETANVQAYRHYLRAQEAGNAGRQVEQLRELDAAIALDSSFGRALIDRILIARAHGDEPLAGRLERRLLHGEGRLTARDRLQAAAIEAFESGDRLRATRSGEALVHHYPWDPGSYGTLARIYQNQGRFADAERTLLRLLALDSLGTQSDLATCVPCHAYSRLTETRMLRGDLAGAERAIRRLVALQPANAQAWMALADVLARQDRTQEALAAAGRGVSLSGNDPIHLLARARIQIRARQWDVVASTVAEWERAPSPRLQRNAADLRVALERERGRPRIAAAVGSRAFRADPELRSLLLVQGNTLARLGRFDEAERIYEEQAHGRPPAPLALPLSGADARDFAWAHALLADALFAAGDTVRLRVIADSLAQFAPRSYYARDWRLHHHVRGLIAQLAGRHEEAVAELQSARWGATGWTRTVYEIGRAQLALGRPREAVATLRHAYDIPDAMGRYLSISEVDWLMAQAFRAAGESDSAAVYADYVRAAWRDADPEVRELLAVLD